MTFLKIDISAKLIFSRKYYAISAEMNDISAEIWISRKWEKIKNIIWQILWIRFWWYKKSISNISPVHIFLCHIPFPRKCISAEIRILRKWKSEKKTLVWQILYTTFWWHKKSISNLSPVHFLKKYFCGIPRKCKILKKLVGIFEKSRLTDFSQRFLTWFRIDRQNLSDTDFSTGFQ